MNVLTDTDTAMFVVRADETLCFTNDAGQRLLEAEEARTRRAIAGALRRGPGATASGVSVVRLKSASEAEVFLVVVGRDERDERDTRDTRPPTTGASVAAAATRWRLTQREAEVIALIVNGDANKDVARSLDLSARTVELHISTILRKAGVESRARLIAQFWADAKPRAKAANANKTTTRE